MKILHLVGAQEDSGGILDVIRSLQSATAAQGCEHLVWVNQAYHETRRPPLTYRYSRYLLAESPNHVELLFGACRALIELRRLLRQERVDVLHAHSRGALPLAAALAVLWRRKVLFTNHAYARRVGLYRWTARRRHCHTVLLTPHMARHYRLPLTTPNVCVISPCVADPFFLHPLVERRPAGAAGPGVRFVGVGNLLRWKNWLLVIEALAALRAGARSRLEFHHWGPLPANPESAAYLDELRDRTRRLGLDNTCRFQGFAPSIEAVLRAADWLVVPSTNEPCSGAIIQALALGVPALASASGGNVDLIQPGVTGLLFAPDSATDLAEKFRDILEGRVAIAQPSELRQSVQHRCASVVAGQYLELYRQLAQGWSAVPNHQGVG